MEFNNNKPTKKNSSAGISPFGFTEALGKYTRSGKNIKVSIAEYLSNDHFVNRYIEIKVKSENPIITHLEINTSDPNNLKNIAIITRTEGPVVITGSKGWYSKL